MGYAELEKEAFFRYYGVDINQKVMFLPDNYVMGVQEKMAKLKPLFSITKSSLSLTLKT